jgi:hypothetical protein
VRAGGIHIGERLIEEEDAGGAHQRAPQGNTLTLPSRELPRIAVQHRLQPQQCCDLADAFGDCMASPSANAQREGEVLEHRQMRVESVVLEDHAHVALLRR